LVLARPLAAAEESYVVREASLTVFRDGIVHAELRVSTNETEPLVALPLLSGRVFNVLVTDGAGGLLDYDLEGANMTVYSLGATELFVEYDTDALTRKEAGIWTLVFDAPFRLTVRLPENSTIIYLSGLPNSITSEDGELKVELEPTPAPSPEQAFPSGIIVAAAVCVAVAVGATAFLLVRRRGKLGELRPEEAEVLSFLRERGGRALEAELRRAFPNIPKTSMWRLLRRLEKRGVVKIEKVGLQNVVELL